MSPARPPAGGGKSRAGLTGVVVRLLLVVAGVFGVLELALESAAWLNRRAAVAGRSEAQVRTAILGDLAAFLEQAGRKIPPWASVLLITNELPWRARYLLLPRAVYTYHGPLPEAADLKGDFLKDQRPLLRRLGISWLLYYRRTTTGPYRITEARVLAVAPAEGASPPGPQPPAAGEAAGGWRLLGTGAALLVALGAGVAVLSLAGSWALSYGALSLAYGLGLGGLTLVLFLLSWLGVPLGRGLSLGLGVGVGGLLLAAWRLRPTEPRVGVPPPGGAGRWSGLELLLVLALVLFFLSQAYYAVTTPLSAMDAMGFWGYSAKAIFLDGTVRSPAIVDPLREHPHPRYPLLVPLAQDWVHLVRGRYDDRTVKLLFVGFYLSLVGVAFAAARRWWGLRVGLVTAVLVAGVPALRADGYGAAFALADIPLAALLVSALWCWLRWMEARRGRDLLLASIFFGLAAWTKNEGLAALALFTVLAGTEMMTRGRLRGPALAALAAGWLLIAPWLLVRAGLPVGDENYPAHLRPSVFVAQAGRLPTIGWAWVRELAEVSRWSILWLLAAVAGLVAVRERMRPGCWLVAFGLGQLALYTVVYVVAPWEVSELLDLTVTRVLLAVLPAAVLLCVLVLPGQWGLRSAGEPAR